MSSGTRQRVRHAPSPKKKGGANWLWIAVIAVVVIVGVGAIVLSRDGAGAAEYEVGTEITVTGDALASNGAAVGAKAPTVSGVQPDGDAITIAPGDGKPMVIFGLAHWCPHCQAEVPRVVKYANEGMFDGVEVYGISTRQEKDGVNWPPSTWLDREKWTFPVLADDKDLTAAKAYGLSGFPYMLAIDANGTVVVQTSGEKNQAQMQQIVDAAKSGTETKVADSDERSDVSTTTQP